MELTVMQITHVESYTVQVPAKPCTWHSPSFGPPEWDMAPLVILQLHTDAGLVGLGEVARGIAKEKALGYARGLLGKNPLELNLQALPIGDYFDRAPGIYQAYEMALFDLVGKARQMPAYQLLGGAYRERVLVSLCSGQMTPEDAAAKAKEAADAGYSYLKMKATDTDPVLERIAAIHAAIGEQIKVVIDPMQRLWRPAVLDALCRRLEEYHDNIQCFEDPFSRANLDWYRMMREKIRFPLALHLSEGRDVVEAIKHEACDYLNLGNGMVNFCKVSAIAEMAGIPVWHGSGVGLGISEAAILHAAAATAACTLSSDVVGEKIRRNDLIVEPIRFEEGHALVPQGPGLGVVLDMAAVEQYGFAG
jgi:muconate cycloisomerase